MLTQLRANAFDSIREVLANPAPDQGDTLARIKRVVELVEEEELKEIEVMKKAIEPFFEIINDSKLSAKEKCHRVTDFTRNIFDSTDLRKYLSEQPGWKKFLAENAEYITSTKFGRDREARLKKMGVTRG